MIALSDRVKFVIYWFSSTPVNRFFESWEWFCELVRFCKPNHSICWKDLTYNNYLLMNQTSLTLSWKHQGTYECQYFQRTMTEILFCFLTQSRMDTLCCFFSFRSLENQDWRWENTIISIFGWTTKTANNE